MGFLDIVKQHYHDGKVSLQGVKLNEDFTVERLVQTAHSVLTPLVIQRTDPRITWTTVGQTTVASSYTGQSPNGVQMKFEFMSDASVMQIKTIALKGLYSIFIDGKLANIDQIDAGSVTNQISWIEVKANEGVSKKIRHYEIYGINTAIGAIVIQATDTFSNDLPSRPLIYQVGDSYTNGTGGGFPGRPWNSSYAVNDFYTYSRALGFDGYAEGVGSSGWNSDGSTSGIPKTLTRFSGRMVNFNRKIDVIMLSLGLNDASTINVVSNQQRLVANFNECMKEMRKNFPTTPCVLISCATPRGLTDNQIILNNLLKGECGKYNIQYIDVSNIINEANSVVYGTPDSDGRVHPNSTGHQLRGLEIAKRILKAAMEGKNLFPPVSPSSFKVTFIERNGFAVNVKTETVMALSKEDAVRSIQARAVGKPDLRFEIIRVE